MKIEFYKYWLKIGLNIAYYRKERGLTQLDLAELSGISRNHIQKIESGNSASLNALINISQALNISLSEIFEFRE